LEIIILILALNFEFIDAKKRDSHILLFELAVLLQRHGSTSFAWIAIEVGNGFHQDNISYQEFKQNPPKASWSSSFLLKFEMDSNSYPNYWHYDFKSQIILKNLFVNFFQSVKLKISLGFNRFESVDSISLKKYCFD
jgi:hypothetical protein